MRRQAVLLSLETRWIGRSFEVTDGEIFKAHEIKCFTFYFLKITFEWFIIEQWTFTGSLVIHTEPILLKVEIIFSQLITKLHHKWVKGVTICRNVKKESGSHERGKIKLLFQDRSRKWEDLRSVDCLHPMLQEHSPGWGAKGQRSVLSPCSLPSVLPPGTEKKTVYLTVKPGLQTCWQSSNPWLVPMRVDTLITKGDFNGTTFNAMCSCLI